MFRRLVFALLIVLSLPGAWPGGAAHAAAPALIPPGEITPLREIRPGMKGYGLTVFRGTRVQRFEVTVVDILTRYYLGQDMLLIRMRGGPITERGASLIAGMSGSPIYLRGRLAGAVSMRPGFFPREPLAIVTPIEAMSEAFDPRLPSKPMLTSMPRGLDEDAPALLAQPPADPVAGLRPLITPLTTRGLSPAGSRYLARLVRPFGLRVAAGGGGKAPAGNAPLQPGSAIGVAMVTGDIDIAATGTLTYRKGNRILAFGHPMYQIGAVDLPMTTAYIHDIWCGIDESFRLDSPGKTIGSIVQDRPFAVAGRIGKMPHLVPVEIAVRDETTGRAKVLHVRTADHPLLTPGLIQMAAGEAITRVRAYPGESMARVQVSVEADGLPPLVRANTVFDYFDPNGFDYPALRDLGDLLSILSANPFGQVPIRRVRLSVTITPGRKTATLERVAVDRDRVQPGEKVRVSATLRPWKGAPEVRTLEVKIPEAAPDGRAYITISGGAGGLPPRPSAGGGMIIMFGGGRAGQSEPATNVRQLIGRYLDRERNDEVAARLYLPTPSGSLEGQRLFGLPAPLADVMRSSKATGFFPMMEEVRQRFPVGRVVTGSQAIPITIQRRALSEKRRPQPPPSGPGAPPMQTQPQPMPGSPGGSVAYDMESTRMTAEQPPSPERKPDAAPPPAEAGPLPTEGDDEEEEASEPSQSAPAAAGGPRKRPGRQTVLWSQRSYRDWERGETHGTAVSTAGTIELASSVVAVHRLRKERLAWALAAGPAGDVYIGTAIDGRVYHRSPAGKVRLVLDAPEATIQALALDKKGNLYAGAGPGGAIYRVPAGGKMEAGPPRPYFRTGQRYVLSLVADAAGNLYAGTGGAGRIYRVTPDGKGEVYFTTPEPHVLRLALDAKGALLAGTAEQGVVYRITGPKQGAAVMDTGDRAVGGLGVDSEGRIVAGTAPRGLILREGLARPLYEARAPVLALGCAPGGLVYAGAGAKLLRVAGEEDATTLECTDQGQLLALALDGRGKLWAGTGNGAGLYTLKAPGAQGTYDSVVRDAETNARWGRISWEAAVPEGAAVVVRTRSGNTPEPDASWSPWSPDCTDAAGTPVQSPPAHFVQYRVALQAGARRVGRGLDGAGPVLKSVTLSYLPENRPPRVEWRSPLVGTAVSGKASLSWTGSDPDRDTVAYELFYSADARKTWQQMQPAAPDKPSERKPGASNGDRKESTPPKPADGAPAPAAPPAAPGAAPAPAPGAPAPPVPPAAGSAARPTSPAAEPAPAPVPAPAGEAKKPDTKPAQPVEGETPKPAPAPPKPGPVTSTSFRWETSGLADGPYLLKIVASDNRSNPGDPRTAERIIGPVLLSNAKPKVTLDKDGLKRDAEGRVTLRGRVEDPRVPITSISYRVDGGDWLAAAPADGMLDSGAEEFTLTTEKLAPGPHKIEVEAVNLADGSAAETVEAK